MVTAMAGSLETVVLAQAASLLSGGMLLRERRATSMPRSESQSSIGNCFREQLQSLRMVGAVSLFCLVLASALLSSLAGSSSLETIEATLRNSYRPERSELVVGDGSILGVAAVVLVFVGCGAQLGLVPLQGVLSSGFEAAPAGVTAVTVAIQRLQAMVVVWKLTVVTMPGFESTVQVVCVVLGAVSSLMGAVLACRSESLRGLAGNFWMSWGGIVLVALACGVTSAEAVQGTPEQAWQFPSGIEAGVLALLTSTIAVGMLLACDRWLAPEDRHVDFMEDLTGLGKQQGPVAFAVTCSLLTLCAIPPLPGFWCTVLLAGNAFLPGVESTQGPSLVPDASVVAAMVVVLVSLLLLTSRAARLLSLMYQHEPIRRLVLRGGHLAVGGAIVASACLVWIGLFPGRLLALLHELPL